VCNVECLLPEGFLLVVLSVVVGLIGERYETWVRPELSPRGAVLRPVAPFRPILLVSAASMSKPSAGGLRFLPACRRLLLPCPHSKEATAPVQSGERLLRGFWLRRFKAVGTNRQAVGNGQRVAAEPSYTHRGAIAESQRQERSRHARAPRQHRAKPSHVESSARGQNRWALIITMLTSDLRSPDLDDTDIAATHRRAGETTPRAGAGSEGLTTTLPPDLLTFRSQTSSRVRRSAATAPR
jgi:hypothetical protein